MKRFFYDENGVIALIVAVLAPLIIGLLALGFDGAKLLIYQSKLQDALAEASLGASAFENQADKTRFVESFLKASFGNKNLDFSNIKISTTKYQSQTNQSKDNSTTEIVNAYAELGLPRWFKTLIKQDSTKLAAQVYVEPTRGIKSNVDYLFAMDFSSSMQASFFAKTSNISFCQPNNENYDENICTKLKSGANRAEVMQLVIAKIIDIINTNSRSTSYFAFLPFYAGSQIEKPFNYTVSTGSGTTEQSARASYYVLQMSFKPEYALSDYDFWSGVMPIGQAVINNMRLTFDSPPYNTHEEHDRALRFFQTFTRPKQNLIHSHIEDNLPKVIDYEETLRNMFDPNKIFSFRFYGPQDSNSLIPEARINGVAYDYYGDRTNISSQSSRRLNMKFYEEDFRPISNPRSVRVLNTTPFDREITGGGLTLVTTALLRGAAMLTKGRNKNAMMIVITDGIDDEGNGFSFGPEAELLAMENRLFSMGLCRRIKQGLKQRGVDSEIFFINIAQKNQSKNTLKKWQECAGEKNAAVVENIDEFLATFKQFVFGNELGRFINTDI